MTNLDAAKRRTRNVLVRSMRACVARHRLRLIARAWFLTGCRLLRPALDIDSDEPLESEYAQRVGPTGKVIAIEASPANVRRLRANLEPNGAAGIVDVVMTACAQQKGEITFYEHPSNDSWSRLTPPAKGEFDRFYMGKTWIPVTVPADTLGSIAGSEAERVSFIKLHIEGAEALVAPEIPGNFPHPRLVVALLAKEPHIDATLKPFEEQGNDYRWLFQRTVPALTEAAYDDFNSRHTAYILLSRQALTLE